MVPVSLPIPARSDPPGPQRRELRDPVVESSGPATLPLDLRILAGADALAFVESPEQVDAWERLRSETPWGTAFQHPAIVRIWYRHYRETLEPVVVLARAGTGQLVGLFCLCRDARAKKLLAAGTHQAEFQTWLCTATAPHFPQAALEAVRARFPGHGMRVCYVAPGTPLDGLLDAPRLAALIDRFTHRRPLHEPSAAGGHHRTAKRRLNQLRRLGEVRFRFVETAGDFARWLSYLSVCYDLRQGAAHGDAPFLDDPAKRGLHVDWFAAGSGVVEACVLELNRLPIAGLFGMVSGDTLHNCVVAHSPLLARYSPGSVLLMLLAEALPSRGLARLDLTPGGDPWKERYADRHDEVVELIVHSSRVAATRARLVRRLRRAARWVLKRISIGPETLRASLSSLARVRRLAVPREVAAGGLRPARLRVYRADLASWRAVDDLSLCARDRLQDLLCFDPERSWLSRRGFWSMALQRLESGEHVYTRVEDGKLVHCAWSDV